LFINIYSFLKEDLGDIDRRVNQAGR